MEKSESEASFVSEKLTVDGMKRELCQLDGHGLADIANKTHTHMSLDIGKKVSQILLAES